MKYNTQETTDGIEFQIKRLQSLRSYPKNDGELIRVAREYTPSVEALRSAITELVERETDCPRPADLRTMLFNRRPQGKRRCELCNGVGYQLAWYLVTRTRDQNGYESVSKQPISPDQARELRIKVGTNPLKPQSVLEGADPCSCSTVRFEAAS